MNSRPVIERSLMNRTLVLMFLGLGTIACGIIILMLTYPEVFPFLSTGSFLGLTIATIYGLTKKNR